jgi:hypothetical protein
VAGRRAEGLPGPLVPGALDGRDGPVRCLVILGKYVLNMGHIMIMLNIVELLWQNYG